MGAWIETSMQRTKVEKYIVAPYMGAWIETVILYHALCCTLSLPIWERGLKLAPQLLPVLAAVVSIHAPVWGATMEIP